MPCPPTFFSLGCVWRGFKNKSDVCHVLCEELFNVRWLVTHSQVDVETVWCGIIDSVSL